MRRGRDHLDDIRRQAASFPIHVLDGCKTAICFFAAGFLGRNVEIHILDAGIQAVAVDWDEERVARMARLYHGHEWLFVYADAYAALTAFSSKGEQFDVVTVDPPLAQMQRCFAELERFRSLGARLVLGISPDMAQAAIEAGASEIVTRSKVASWAVWTPSA